VTVRHHGEALVLALRPGTTVAEPARSWRGPVTALAAIVALTASLTLLLTGAVIVPAAAKGPCPPRASIASYAGGRQLLIRAEPARGATTLLHLCAGKAIGPVLVWEVSLTDGGRAQPIAVQRLSGSAALAAAPLAGGRHGVLSVAVTPETGRALTFTARVAAG